MNNIKKIKQKRLILIILFSLAPIPTNPTKIIDFLNYSIMPELIKKFPNLKLVITGGGFDQNFPWLINKGIVKKLSA